MWPTMEQWRSTVPRLMAHYAERWDLTLGDGYPGGSASRVMRARTADGVDAVLKLSLPHREAREEALALQWWAGDGAIRLLATDPGNAYVLLLERCEPGVPLSEREDLSPDHRLTAAAGLLSALWQRGTPDASTFETIADVCREWADVVQHRMEVLRPPFDPAVVAHGAELLRELPGSAARDVIVHGDFNPGNVLQATREPWLVIDPKPMRGDPAYDLCPLLMQVDDPFRHRDPGPVIRRRVRFLADLTGEPGDRILAWAVARHVEAGLWYASRSEIDEGKDSLSRAAVLAGL